MINEVVALVGRLMIYSGMFIASLYFVNQADKAKSKGKFIFLSLLALIIPCFFAAFRGEKVGTDVLQYAKPYYLEALNSSSLQSFLLQGSAETGYEVFVFVITKIFKNFNAILFFTEALIICPIYIVAIKNRKNCPMWVTLLVYYMIFYIASFNFMRQSIAAALLLLAYFELVEKKWLKFIILILLAQSFHNTAFIGLAVILFGIWFYRIQSKQLRILVFVISCILLIAVLQSWQNILMWAINDVNILPRRFITYINIFAGGHNKNSYYFILTKSNYVELIFRWILYVVPLFLCKYSKRQSNLYNSANIILLMSVVVYTVLFVLFHTSYAVRITWYMEYFFIVWLPMSYSKLRENNVKFGVVHRNTACMFIAILGYWFCGYMILGWHGTLPFYFSFQ
ncbi:MAG: EpsG family protein [Coprococcus sp.]|nr:EpsG family protein [Coprococcus sp.]